MREYVLYCDDGIELHRYTNIVDAYKGLQAEKKNPLNKFVWEYYFEIRERIGNIEYAEEVKIYRRKNKVFCRSIA